MFVDPIADVAVPCEPDNQYYLDGQWEIYQSLIEDDEEIVPFIVAEAPAQGTAQLLSLDGRWFGCSLKRQQPDSSLWIFGAEERHCRRNVCLTDPCGRWNGNRRHLREWRFRRRR